MLASQGFNVVKLKDINHNNKMIMIKNQKNNIKI